MEHAIILGTDVRCVDDKVGNVAGVVINPNRNDVDYIIMNPGLLGGREYYVPRGHIGWGAGGDLLLECGQDELDALPRPTVAPESGTMQSNIGDFCMARKDTPVRDDAGGTLGSLHGVVIDPESFMVRAVLLDRAPDQPLPIERVAKYNDPDEDALVVYPARAATV
jgi:hypothetical protein